MLSAFGGDRMVDRAVFASNKHTIILMQTSHNRATRTFMDYESISQAMDGMCRLYTRFRE
ncbi:putative enhancer of rudimentary [Helianthus annuus]|nr:putative enhancer of rudimentary [Helianthus annuus]